MDNVDKYSVSQYSVKSLLGYIDAGDIAIPEIQRPFVWNATQVRDLIDSLYNGYPTGYLIIWQNPDVKLKNGESAVGKKILIDGQQRVTAIMTAIAGVKILTENYLELFRVLWEEELIFDKRVEEQNFMLDNNLRTDDDLQQFKAKNESELKDFDEARHNLRKALRRAMRAGNTEEIEKLRRDISQITEAMSLYRKEIKICDRILDDAPEIEKQMKYIKERTEQIRQRNRNKGGWER